MVRLRTSPRLLVSGLAMLLVGCGLARTASPHAPGPDGQRQLDRWPSGARSDVVARVGKEEILLDEVRRSARLTSPGPGDAASDPVWFRAALEMLVDERVLLAEARRLRVDVTREEVEECLRGIAAVEGRSLDAHWKVVRAAGWEDAEYRDLVRRRLVERRVFDLQVRSAHRIDGSDVDGAFDYEAMHDVGPELRILVVPNKDGESSGIRLAEVAAKRLRSGEDFCELVRELSTDALARESCGQVHVSVIRRQAAKLLEVIAELRDGETSQPTVVEDVIVIVKKVKARRRREDSERLFRDAAYHTTLRAAEASFLARLRERANVWLNVTDFPVLAPRAASNH